ncbi:MAG: ATPase, T2SS/T4P/T4SS family, partial [Candidatus Micrarchaeota archaeon]
MELRINPELCSRCGMCIDACPRKGGTEGYAIFEDEKERAKCNLCEDQPSVRCLEACPLGAIESVFDQQEQDEIKKILGWKKLSDFEFKTKCPRLGIEEVRMIDRIISAHRKEGAGPEDGDVKNLVDDYCAAKGVELDKRQGQDIIDALKAEIRGLSAIDFLLLEPELEEISVINEKSPVYVYHRKYGWMKTDLQITSRRKISEIINKIGRSLGRRVSYKNPEINANIPFGRVHAAISPVSISGPCITIRKFSCAPFTASELVRNGTISAQAMAFLSLAVKCDINILICGNTGSGKTSTLNTLFEFIPKDERVIAIEDTPEISVKHKHFIRLNSSKDVSMEALVSGTLRMRPDRVIVSEVRTAPELGALINSMLAGQGKGTLSTFHAHNSDEALTRMKRLGVSEMDAGAIDLIVVQKRWSDLSKKEMKRRVTEITAVEKCGDGGGVKLKKLFEYAPT